MKLKFTLCVSFCFAHLRANGINFNNSRKKLYFLVLYKFTKEENKNHIVNANVDELLWTEVRLHLTQYVKRHSNALKVKRIAEIHMWKSRRFHHLPYNYIYYNNNNNINNWMGNAFLSHSAQNLCSAKCRGEFIKIRPNNK